MQNNMYKTKTAGSGLMPHAASTPRHRHLKRLLALAFALFVGMQWGYAYDFGRIIDGNTLYFTVESYLNRTVYVTHPTSFYAGSPYQAWNGHTKPSGAVNVPATVTYNNETYTVTEIGSYAFYGCNDITSVTIPSTVTSIRSSAFYGVDINTISIPSNVNLVGSGAFLGCNNLKIVYIYSNAVASYPYTNYNNSPESSGLKTVFGNQVTEYYLIGDVTEIGTRAFYGSTKMTKIGIHCNLTSIGREAFYDCTGLTSVTIPSTVTSIGDWAFYGCSNLNNVHIANLRSWCEIDFGNYISNPLYCAQNLYLNNGLVTTLNNIGSPTAIKAYAFCGYTKITSANIPSSVTSIGGYAFSGCTNITSVTIPSSVTSIGNGAFKGTNLTSVTIPSGVTTLGNEAFANCARLTSVTINSNAVASAGYTYSYSNYTGHVYDNLKSRFGDQVTSYTFGAPVTAIGNNALRDCSRMTQLTFNGSLTSIGESAFHGCSGLTSFTIPSSLTSIGNSTFYGCSGLTSVTIPSGVTSIGNDAFMNCSGLTKVTLPNSLTSIGNSAFNGCTGLTKMTVKATNPPTATYNTFWGVTKTIPVFVPSSSVQSYKNANVWQDFFNITTTPKDMPYSQLFSSNTIPSEWSCYEGELQWDSNLGTGTATLTGSNTWYFGEANDVFNSHAFTNIGQSANQHKWLVSPAIIIDDIDDAYLSVSLALTRTSGAPITPGMQDHQSLGIYVTDDYGATWHKLLTFANEGGDLPFEDALTATSLSRAFSLADFRGKTVNIGFYASCTDVNDNLNRIHLDYFSVQQRTTMNQKPSSVFVQEVAGHSAKVKWTAGSNLQMEWDIWVSSPGSFPENTIDFNPSYGHFTHLSSYRREWVPQNLTPNTEYAAWVRYNDGHITSDWTKSESFTTIPLCNPPTNIVVETTPTSVFVSWEPGQANQTSWTVFLVSGDEWSYYTEETSILINTEGRIEPGESIWVYITASCEDGDGYITTEEVHATIQPWPTLTLNEGQSQDNNIVPITPYVLPDGASETQFIIPASQLDMMQSCVIEQISFHEGYWTNCAPWGENVWFTVRVMEVPEANFNVTQHPEDQFYEYNDNPGFTTYYHGKLRLDSEGMMHIPLGSLGFHYTNANLLVGIKQDTDDAGTEYQSDWLGCSTQNYQSMYLPVDGGDPTSKNFAPMVTFTYRPDTYQPPTNLAAQYVSPREVYYTWTPRPGQQEVTIEIASNPEFVGAQSKTATGEQYTARYSTTLTAGATYYVRAKTWFPDPVNIGVLIDSQWGPTVELLVPDVCDSPSNLVATEVGPFSATLEWEGDADYYELEYRSTIEMVELRCDFEDPRVILQQGWTAWPTNNGWTYQQATNHTSAYMVSSIPGSIQGIYRNRLITPQVELPGRIKFDVNGTNNEKLCVYVSTTGTNLGDFVLVDTYTIQNSGTSLDFQTVEVDLTDYEGSGYIAFAHERTVTRPNSNTYSVAIDDVMYIKVDGWHSAGITSSNPTTLEGLTPGDYYTARVRAICEGSYYNYSYWAYSADFNTVKNIEFEDPEVEALCVAEWDTDYDGKLSYAEAAAVTTLEEVFRGQEDVDTFSELEYFTGLYSIDNYAFYGCTNLEVITIPEQIEFIGEYAFGYCENMSSIDIPSSVEQIWSFAFRGTGLEYIDIPQSVTYLGVLAFAECNNLTAVYLPATVTSMDSNPFAYCENLETIIVSPDNPVFDSRDNCNAIIHTETNKLVSGSNFTSIPETVTTIGDLAFGGARFRGIIIPESVTYIDAAAFYNCTNLIHLNVLATTPPALGNQVFDNVDKANCVALTSCENVEAYRNAEGWNEFIWTGMGCDIILHIEAYTNDTDGWNLIASPIFSVSPGSVDNMLEETYDLYEFDGNYETEEWRNYRNKESNGFGDGFGMLYFGKGYLYANSNDVDLVFPGTPHLVNTYNAFLNHNDETKFGNWNLVGNSFTTAATVSVDDYYRIDPGTRRLMLSGGLVNAMEGIFVEADETMFYVTFTKATRGERSIESPMVNIDLCNAEGRLLDRARMRMGEGANLSKLDMMSDPNRLYFHIDGKDYAVARVNGQGEMPLHFAAAENGSYTLNVNVEGMNLSYLHLIDNMTGADVDLLASNGEDAKHSTYTFKAKTTDYASRFRLVFATVGEDTNGDDETFAFNHNGNWIIANEGRATLQVIDMQGRILSSEQIEGNAETRINAAAGVYVIRLVNGENVRTQKIVVE